MHSFHNKEAYNHYKDLADHVYNGIDAAFFLGDFFKPPKLELPEFVVLCFDQQKEPRISFNCNIIRTSHYSYPPFSPFSRKALVRKISKKTIFLFRITPWIT